MICHHFTWAVPNLTGLHPKPWGVCAFCMLQCAHYPIITINILLRSNYSSCSNTFSPPLWNPELHFFFHLEACNLQPPGEYSWPVDQPLTKIINPTETSARRLTARSCSAPTSCAVNAPDLTTVNSSITWLSHRQQIVTWNRAKHPCNLWGRSNRKKWGGTYSKGEAMRMNNTFLFWPPLQWPTRSEIKQMKAFWKSETTKIN